MKNRSKFRIICAKRAPAWKKDTTAGGGGGDKHQLYVSSVGSLLRICDGIFGLEQLLSRQAEKWWSNLVKYDKLKMN